SPQRGRPASRGNHRFATLGLDRARRSRKVQEGIVMISKHLRELGIMSTAELLARNHKFVWVRIAERYGNIVRVRKGWYAHPAESHDVIRAWRVGGRLTCVSALAHHGLSEPADALHVEVPANTPRLRNPDDHRRALTADDSVVI